jgi:glucokinase
LVEAGGNVLERAVLSTEAAQGFDRAVTRLIEVIAKWSSAGAAGRISGIGIGCAGPLDPKQGLINNPYTLEGWDHCDIVTPLRERFGVSVYLENDADVAAYGEAVSGAGCGFDPVVMLTFGTGIGGAVIVGGQIYRGANGEHPELGHISVLAEGPECYCGTRGCLEVLASGAALEAAGRQEGFKDARAVFEAANAGQPAAEALVERALEASVRACWTLSHTFLPQRLILGGGIMDEHFELFARAIDKQLAKATQFTKGAVSVVPAALGNDAGMIGAASLAMQRD